MTSKQSKWGLIHGWRSGLEKDTGEDLSERGVEYAFEEAKIPYLVPSRSATYKPDFIIKRDKRFPDIPTKECFLSEEWCSQHIIIETKGRFTLEDRKKHLWIKDQFPLLDLRFIFSRSSQRISKQSKTSYAMWCDKYGFLYADKKVPDEWFDE